MGYELIITEKPQAASKIAMFLADGKPIKKNHKGVPYYEITHGGRDIVVACAVGHLYTVSEKKKNWSYPSFDVEWVQSSKVNKASSYTSKYATALRALAKGADEFTVATDFDIEGEVIGYNIIRHICKKKDANRMKYSTLTRDEIRKSYKNKMKHLVWGQVNAGVTRHELDWYYGINVSRALTSAIKSTGSFKIMSSGRVQGPALKILCEKEKEISSFKPVPYWQIELEGKLNSEDITAMHKEDKFWEKEKADTVMKNVSGKDGVVDSIKAKSFRQAPPTPFDLTTLQIEAYRSVKIQPKVTLEIAQELYISGLISYPRTSSQQLPKDIGYSKILNGLKKNGNYKKLAEKLLSKPDLKPNNGKKTDPAHPAIYPTGQQEDVSGNKLKAKIYDLIVRRFLATFAEPAKRETVTIGIDVNKEPFVSKGTRTVEKGWHEFYGPHVKLEEQTLPSCKEGDKVSVTKIDMQDKETQPPKRYTPASIIKELEKRNLGTKATRATIIENLFSRGYVNDKSINVTDLGMKTCQTLEKYSPSILDEKLTRSFEDEMQRIRDEKETKETVLEKARNTLTTILKDFKEKEKDIGTELKQAHFDSMDAAATLGDCPVCKEGKLMIKKGKYGRFVACNRYPDCKTTLNIPNTGTIRSLKKQCEKCGYPLVSIQSKGKKPQHLCINPLCPSKTNGDSGEELHYPEEGMECPTCKKGKMVLRKGFYGEFLGCNRYPKCKTMMKIVDGKVDTKAIVRS